MATMLDPLAMLDPRPLWQAQVPPAPDRSGRPLPDAVDLLVVGGGYTGVAAARRAALLGARVAAAAQVFPGDVPAAHGFPVRE